jgi:polyferredoxin
MIDSDAQSFVGTKLTGFHIAPTRVVHLSFLQNLPKQLTARPERLYAQIWLIRPKRVVFKLTNRDRMLVNVTFEKTPESITSVWSFGDDEMLSVECKSISHVFFPVVTWVA